MQIGIVLSVPWALGCWRWYMVVVGVEMSRATSVMWRRWR